MNELVITAAQIFAVPVDIMLAAGVVCLLPVDVVLILKRQNVIDANGNMIVDGGVVEIQSTDKNNAIIILKNNKMSHEFTGS